MLKFVSVTMGGLFLLCAPVLAAFALDIRSISPYSTTAIAFTELEACKNADPNDIYAEDYIVSVLLSVAQTAFLEDSIALKHELIDSLIAFPNTNDYIESRKVLSLSDFQYYPPAYQYVHQALTSQADVVREAAAEVLVSWGKYEDAEATIQELKLYLILQKYPTEDARQMLTTAMQSGEWEHRLHAAYALRALGDTSAVYNCSRDIVINAPLTGDISAARSKYIALKKVTAHKATDLVSDIARFAEDESELVRMAAIDMLYVFATHNVSSAVNQLEYIAQNCSYPFIKDSAQKYLDQLN